MPVLSCFLFSNDYHVNMGITLSHISALHAMRVLRSDGRDLKRLDPAPVATPAPWVGKRWSMHEFAPDVWKWQQPTAQCPLDVLVPSSKERLRMKNVHSHICSRKLPPKAVRWLDNNTSIASPQLVFLQMAEVLDFHALILLAYELCGHFSRCAGNPLSGPIVDNICAATSVTELRDFLKAARGIPGVQTALTALEFVADNALSAPESILGMMYSLPPSLSGYGMGPITLNQRVPITSMEEDQPGNSRYPDLMFSFAPVGINYDGSEHLNLDRISRAAHSSNPDEDESESAATKAVRDKYLDDLRRNRELLAEGKIVLPAVKEDLEDGDHLDKLTFQILRCAKLCFSADVQTYERTLFDTFAKRGRDELLGSVMPGASAIAAKALLL